jgi:flagellar basal body-associated protein FliL
MTQDKNIGGKIALIVGIVLLVGAATLLIVKLVQAKKGDDEQEPEASKTPARPASTSTTQSNQNSGPSEVVKRMQSYLLNLGINYGNNEMIDAIRLTGGVDGYKGDGFELALLIAIEKGYVKSYNDLLSRVS